MDLIAPSIADTSEWIELDDRGRDHRRRSTPIEAGAGRVRDDPIWVAPAFWDIQTNGRWGHSFSSPDLTVEQVVEIVRAQAALGTARLCPTLITAPLDAHAPRRPHDRRGLRRRSRRRPDGRWASTWKGRTSRSVDGYRGAHPPRPSAIPTGTSSSELQEASGDRVVLMTLAPERPGAIEFIRQGRAQRA